MNASMEREFLVSDDPSALLFGWIRDGKISLDEFRGLIDSLETDAFNLGQDKGRSDAAESNAYANR